MPFSVENVADDQMEIDESEIRSVPKHICFQQQYIVHRNFRGLFLLLDKHEKPLRWISEEAENS